MKYVYVISCYDEHGPLRTAAMLNRDDILPFVEKWFSDVADLDGLKEILRHPDGELGERQDFGKHWGGPVLQAVLSQGAS